MSHRKNVVAFITPEIAIHESLHTYSGGLGVIGGSMIGAAHRMKFPFVAVSLLYREGYYDQGIALFPDGRREMKIEYISRHYPDILEDTGVTVHVPLAGSMVAAKVWRLPESAFHTSEVLFLDVDIDGNDHLTRLNGMRLYPGLEATDYDHEKNDRRTVAQWIVLGFGAVQALEKLGYEVDTYHLNEGHSLYAAFSLVERAIGNGMTIEDAIQHTKKRVVFTTHTPVQAGNRKYPRDLIEHMLARPKLQRLIDRSVYDGYFDVTAACLTLSGMANAVSRKHRHSSNRMWHWLRDERWLKDDPTRSPAEIKYVTNGSDQSFWQDELYRHAKKPSELREVKRVWKYKLLEFVRSQTGKEWRDDVITLVWARRFAGYKRPKLLVTDLEWFAKRLEEGAIQVIYAGKPHPDDQTMIREWNDLCHLSQRYLNLAVFPGYELDLSKLLKRGADCWLNTPAAPLEASGTSGQSAAMNGAINISTPDGWYLEADPANYFGFGLTEARPDQDVLDGIALPSAIDQRVLPLYYDDKVRWYEMALDAKDEAEDRWSSIRMLGDYEKYVYGPLRSSFVVIDP